MNIGDIVRLKKGHALEKFLQGKCIIDVVTKYNIKKKLTRYHIKTLDGKDCMTWVHIDEVEMVSNLREQTLEKLGI